MKLTGWYQSNQKPIRSGPYHVSDYCERFGRCEHNWKWWNNKLQKWGKWTGSIEACVKVHKNSGEDTTGNEQNVRWRGVAK